MEEEAGQAIATTGPMRSAGVSIEGGKSESKRVEPQEKVIGFRRGLDDGRIRAARGTERAEVHSAGGDRQKDERGEEQVLPDRVGNERSAVLLRQFVILACVGRAFHETARHRPFVDSELQHHQEMQTHEADQQSLESRRRAARRIEKVLRRR